MSRENVTRFFEAIRADEWNVKRLRALEEDLDAFARLSSELGRERGLAFEPTEVREVLAALATKAEGQLSDTELGAVSGGTRSNVFLGRPTALMLSGNCPTVGGCVA